MKTQTDHVDTYTHSTTMLRSRHVGFKYLLAWRGLSRDILLAVIIVFVFFHPVIIKVSFFFLFNSVVFVLVHVCLPISTKLWPSAE
jgi:hypothetical protein